MAKKSYSNFFAGALFGIAIGLLLAPTSNENKKQLKNKMEKLNELIQDIDYDDVRELIEQQIISLTNDLEALDKETVLTAAKEKAEMIIEKAEELISLSRSVNVPVVEKAATDVKKGTMALLKDVLEKIDEKEELDKKTDKLEKKSTPKKATKKKGSEKKKGSTVVTASEMNEAETMTPKKESKSANQINVVAKKKGTKKKSQKKNSANGTVKKVENKLPAKKIEGKKKTPTELPKKKEDNNKK